MNAMHPTAGSRWNSSPGPALPGPTAAGPDGHGPAGHGPAGHRPAGDVGPGPDGAGPRFGFRGRGGRRRPPFEPRTPFDAGRPFDAGPPFGPMTATTGRPPRPFEDSGDEERPRRHGRRGGPPFGPDLGPRMRGGFPGRRGRGRRTARGDIRAAVLALVAEQPRHGYEIIQEIATRSAGAWRPSPGSVYPTISQLEDEGLVRVEQAEGRRVVHLTDAGTTYVEEHRSELDAVWASIGRDADDEAGELWEQLGQLHAAATQVLNAGNPEQIAAATTALTETRKTIYRLLAE